MKISIFGMGYVGTVMSCVLANEGHIVYGIDINDDKISLLKKGILPFTEPKLNKILISVIKNSTLIPTNDIQNALDKSEISFICVGTPNIDNGDLDLTYVFKTFQSIYDYYETNFKDKTINIAIRSTVKPGTIRSLVQSLNQANNNYKIYMNPEFLREGTAVDDFYNTDIVIGTKEIQHDEIFQRVYKFVNKDIHYTSVETAEMIKYINNSYHALKVAFTNEIATICNNIGIDPFELMKIFTSDKKLNISDKYFRPGYAYGGSCLPKDLKALNYLAEKNQINVPILNAIDVSNKVQINNLYDLILSYGKNKIGFYGITFKSNTDDLRGSPIINVIKKLIKMDVNISILDYDINVKILSGYNKEIYNFLIENGVCHFSDENLFFGYCEMLIINKEVKSKDNINNKCNIIDLQNFRDLYEFENYTGFNWKKK